MEFLGRYLEIAFILILVFIVVTNPFGFSTSIGALGNLNTGAIKAFQGR